MLTDGRFSSCSDYCGDKRADSLTCTHEHTISGPYVNSHSGTHSWPDEFPLFHPCSNTDLDTVGNGYIHRNGHSDTYKHSFTVTGSNRAERPNSHFNTGNIGDIVTYACTDCYASTH